MLTQQELEKYLSLCMDSEGDFAEIYEENEFSETIRTLNGKAEKTERAITSGIGIRLYKDLQSVYGYSNETDEASILTLINDLREAVGTAQEAPAEPVHLTRGI